MPAYSAAEPPFVRGVGLEIVFALADELLVLVAALVPEDARPGALPRGARHLADVELAAPPPNGPFQL